MWRRLLRWLRGEGWRDERFEQLPDPFRAEVLLDGTVVGVITDRHQVEMFWFSYALEPLDVRVLDDGRWERCRFHFRDPPTGRVCIGAFPGGRAPFVRDGRVLIRALYFCRRPGWLARWRDRDVSTWMSWP